MFFTHIRNVLEYSTVTYPDIRFIMWDDMFRDASVDIIKGKTFDISIKV